jgi:alpha-beta hydrolase superfamily lysophospholipase
VQITHGIAEHSGRYDRFARFLAAAGYVVYALDLRGHGETAGLDNLGQARLTAWEDMTADIKQLAEIARSEYPALSLIAFGHSMGSALTQSHIQNHGHLLAGAILCGTMGAIPGLDEAQYQSVIQELQPLATGFVVHLPPRACERRSVDSKSGRRPWGVQGNSAFAPAPGPRKSDQWVHQLTWSAKDS